MGPIFEKLKEGSPPSIRHVRFDLTDDLGVAIAKEVAAGYGIEDLFTYSKRTGYIILVDAARLTLIDQLDITLSPDEMRRRIKDASDTVDR